MSQFLSPRTNLRHDGWGGALANPARLLLEVAGAVRATVGENDPIAVKLNSSDFVKGGFTLEDCREAVRRLGDAGVDLLEVSGGNYERIEFFKAVPEREIRDSARLREEPFPKYSAAIKALARMPILLTGGFRARGNGGRDRGRRRRHDRDRPAVQPRSGFSSPHDGRRSRRTARPRGPARAGPRRLGAEKPLRRAARPEPARPGGMVIARSTASPRAARLAPEPDLSPPLSMLARLRNDFGRAVARRFAALGA